MLKSLNWKPSSLTLKLKLASSTEENKKVVADALERGRADGLSTSRLAGKTEGLNEGREAYLQSKEFKKSISESRLQGDRDFLKAPAFKMGVDIQSARYLNKGFDKCISQVQHLKGFVDGFDQDQLDPSLNAILQPYV
ncbi:hypothetical protein Salat_0200200 [Sesamum alatum]|uniref:Uncharacterized protein n=1 Tax=Sesamum alatum TaxID=300844 RepID=A0AAE1YYM0_9LAMI|nr:hypothetical protein Salat_0200200 [Sesamum alatum]